MALDLLANHLSPGGTQIDRNAWEAGDSRLVHAVDGIWRIPQDDLALFGVFKVMCACVLLFRSSKPIFCIDVEIPGEMVSVGRTRGDSAIRWSFSADL